MNILIIGFGNMGCRHAQAFLHDNSYKVYVIEPNDNVFNTNVLRIGGTKENINRTSFSEIPKYIFDFAVIATSAEVRLSLFKEVLNIGIKKILLEKVVFQSAEQFDIAFKLIQQHNASVYCNFLNRYSQSYIKIKKSIKGKMNFTVTGGHFGFACNALHYIDLFKYLIGTDINLIKSNLVKSESPNIRGDKYVEVFGQQIWESINGDRLIISSDSENNSGKGSENHIIYDDNIHILNENTLNQLNIEFYDKLEVEKFDMPMASKLTATIYQDIKTGDVALPDLMETMKYHVQFFESINNCLGLSKNELCPIT